jgi:iron complex transport system substrate-binding protein
MRHTRFRLLAVTLLAAALTACGSGGGAETGGPAPATRVVTDETGTQVSVPTNPQRVVTTHFLLTMGTLDLGVTPIGTAGWVPENLPEAYVTALRDVPVVTSQNADPDLEKIALAKPDLILTTSFTSEQALGAMRAIAPTYLINVSAGGANATSWVDRTRQLADVLGRTAEADRLASDFEARRQEIVRTFGTRIDGSTAAVAAGFQEGNASVFSAGSGIGQILTSLGFAYSPRADAVAAPTPNGIGTVSYETLGNALGDADVLFLASDLRGTPTPFVVRMQQSPLYGTLPAVKEDRVGTFKPQVTGYTDATFALDQIERTLNGAQGSG